MILEIFYSNQNPVYKYKNNYYIHKDFSENFQNEKKKISKNFYRISKPQSLEKDSFPNFNSQEYIEMIFEIENLESIIKKNKIEFQT
jgi:hypothetical protein